MPYKGFIGSYTKKDGKGIYRFELDRKIGAISQTATGYEIEASTYLARSGTYLYAITKDGDQCGVASFEIDGTGRITPLNTCLASTKGTGCYLEVSPDGQYLFEAVYGAGVARMYRLNKETGEVDALIDEVQHDYPTGPNEDRQDAPHVHMLTVTPDQRYVVAMDLGTDRVVTYTYDEQGLHVHHVTEVEPGDGPRHMVFHENGKYAYLVHELSNQVSVLAYEDGAFKALSRHATIPNDFTGDTKLAAVRLAHNHRHLYVSNRGHDSIAIFDVAYAGDALEPIDIVPSGGEFPRDFNISPDDKYLVCAHQEGKSLITVFERDLKTGQLTLTDAEAKAPEGVCVTFLG